MSTHMNKDDILRMAQEAGGSTDDPSDLLTLNNLERFANFVLHAACEAQVPVAWMVYTLDGRSVCVTDNPADFTEQHKALPLYTAPPQLKPLTDEEIHDCFQQKHKDKVTERRMITRAIERAHGIKDA